MIDGDCEVRLRSSSQKPPDMCVKYDQLQPRIEPITWDLSPVRGTARLCRCQTNETVLLNFHLVHGLLNMKKFFESDVIAMQKCFQYYSR